MSSVARRPDGMWRARYRDSDGREHAQHFDTEAAAWRWLDGEDTAMPIRDRHVKRAYTRSYHRAMSALTARHPDEFAEILAVERARALAGDTSVDLPSGPAAGKDDSAAELTIPSAWRRRDSSSRRCAERITARAAARYR